MIKGEEYVERTIYVAEKKIENWVEHPNVKPMINAVYSDLVERDQPKTCKLSLHRLRCDKRTASSDQDDRREKWNGLPQEVCESPQGDTKEKVLHALLRSRMRKVIVVKDRRNRRICS